MGVIDDIKAQVSCFDACEMLGIELDHSNKTLAFDRDETQPSVQIYEDHWWDFGAAKGGDVIDLVQAYAGCSRRAAIQFLSGAVDEMAPAKVVRKEKPAPKDFTEALDRATVPWGDHHRDLVAKRWPYFTARASNPRWLENAGYVRPADNGLLVPHYHHGMVVGVKVRHFDGAKSAWPDSQFTTGLYWARRWEDSPPDYLVIAEGESDSWHLAYAMRSNRIKVDVAAMPCGANTWKDAWLDEISHYERIFLAFDNDNTGKQAFDKVSHRVGLDRARKLPVPQLYKDVAEAMGCTPWVPSL